MVNVMQAMNRYQFYSGNWGMVHLNAMRVKVKVVVYTQAMMRLMLRYWEQWMVVLYQRLQAVLLRLHFVL